MSRIRVLIVDDSLFMRAAVRRILEKDARFEVVGEARDGQEGLEKVATLRPDVCTMDFNMPRLDGAQAVRAIMRACPTPVVMLSAHTTQGARETFEALDAGAVDFVSKPSGEVSALLSDVAAELVRKVADAAGARPRSAPLAGAAPPLQARITLPRTAVASGVQLAASKVVVIAVSTGGPAALAQLLPAFPGDTSLALVIVQHLPAGFTAALAERLDSLSALRVREAEGGETLQPGVALIAPGDRHLDFDDSGRVRIFDGPELHGVRPAADHAMVSAAALFGRRSVGVIMTGMGRDGTAGARAIKEAGGAVLAQDAASCVIWGMPRSAEEAGVVDRVLPLDQLAHAIRGA